MKFSWTQPFTTLWLCWPASSFSQVSSFGFGRSRMPKMEQKFLCATAARDLDISMLSLRRVCMKNSLTLSHQTTCSKMRLTSFRKESTSFQTSNSLWNLMKHTYKEPSGSANWWKSLSRSAQETRKELWTTCLSQCTKTRFLLSLAIMEQERLRQYRS